MTRYEIIPCSCVGRLRYEVCLRTSLGDGPTVSRRHCGTFDTEAQAQRAIRNWINASAWTSSEILPPPTNFAAVPTSTPRCENAPSAKPNAAGAAAFSENDTP